MFLTSPYIDQAIALRTTVVSAMAIFHTYRKGAARSWASRVGGGALARWPPSASQTARARFVHAAFTKTQRRRDAREGIKSINRTSSYSP
jgi:hypothetical protein